MIPSLTTQNLEAALQAAVTTNNLPFIVSYVDINQSTLEASQPKTVTGTISGTGNVDLSGSPVAGFARQIKFVNIYNEDTVAATVFVKLKDGANHRIMIQEDMAVGDRLEYTQ